MPLSYRVVAGRSREVVGEYSTRADALELIRELTSEYGRRAVTPLALELQIGTNGPLILGEGIDLLDMASARREE